MSGTSSKLLILHPDSIVEPSIYRASLVHRRLGAFKEIDAGSTGSDPEEVKAEILSGRYGVILVCDLSENFHW